MKLLLLGIAVLMLLLGVASVRSQELLWFDFDSNINDKALNKTWTTANITTINTLHKVVSPQFVSGKMGNALFYPNTNYTLNRTPTAEAGGNTNRFYNFSNYSIAFWAKPVGFNPGDTAHTVYDDVGAGVSGITLAFIDDGSNNVRGLRVNHRVASSNNLYEAYVNASLTNFSHFVIAFNGTSLRWYVNGSLIATVSGVTAPAARSTSTNFIGTSQADNDLTRYNGSLDDFRVYNYSITTNDVSKLYGLGGIGCASNLSVCSLSIQDSANIIIYDETVLKQFWPYTALENETVSLAFIGDGTAFNVTTNNGSLFTSNLTPGAWEVRYSAPSFPKRNYFFNITDLQSLNLELFLLNTTLSTQIITTIVDENDNPINGSILKVYRFYPSINQFKIVEMSRANFNGEAPVNLVLNSQEYKFVVEYLGQVIFSSTETKLTSTTITIQIVLGSDPFTVVKGASNLFTSLTSTQSGDNVTFTYNVINTENFASGTCLVATKITRFGETDLCRQCSTTLPSTLTCNVNTSATLTVLGLVNASSSDKPIITDVITRLTTTTNTFGAQGPLMAMFIALTLIMIGLVSVETTMIMGVIGIAISVVMGVYAVSAGAIFGLLGVALIILFRGRS